MDILVSEILPKVVTKGSAARTTDDEEECIRSSIDRTRHTSCDETKPDEDFTKSDSLTNDHNDRLDSGYTSCASEKPKNNSSTATSYPGSDDDSEYCYSDDVFLDKFQYHWPMPEKYVPDLTPRDPKTGLVDLDQTHPCTSENPCLLDRIVYEGALRERLAKMIKFNKRVQGVLDGTGKVIRQLEEQGF